MADKVYCGVGRQNEKFDGMINISLSDRDVQKIVEESTAKGMQGKRYIKLVLGRRREKGEHGETHWLAIDNYVPKGKPVDKPDKKYDDAFSSKEAKREEVIDVNDDDLPF